MFLFVGVFAAGVAGVAQAVWVRVCLHEAHHNENFENTLWTTQRRLACLPTICVEEPSVPCTCNTVALVMGSSEYIAKVFRAWRVAPEFRSGAPQRLQRFSCASLSRALSLSLFPCILSLCLSFLFYFFFSLSLFLQVFFLAEQQFSYPDCFRFVLFCFRPLRICFQSKSEITSWGGPLLSGPISRDSAIVSAATPHIV